jgi:hypothetical protein
MKFMQTDGGKSVSSRPAQTNDCTIIAVASVTRMTFDEAYVALREVGRRSNHGFRFPANGWPSGPIGGWYFKHCPHRKGQTVGQFLSENPVGVFVLGTTGHVAAVKNGVVWDHSRPDYSQAVREIWAVYKIPT